ncbi:MAG: hypothetical protein VX740_06115 [Pseudomonadota bacterium]|jgi:hypothetical protein|nr:hypothetical protein [Alphaproteobacteria bacterium]MEC7701757.1 hypothetical protein [Pseudomonadota bacterium]MEC9235863.1 hypothetical protein [Pseudomonadota bacterium]MED5422995.1 hypothetical protein [Pseudomonadota bacterium]MEE3322543.1 hypothetical protein [Pseudomonadota bacterium]|tara:strand:- start:260 stop:403 length:144 start_codon:yes stop_codon:yes gene_type:complete
MSGNKDKNEKFDKRAAALRANLTRRKQAKRSAADDAQTKKQDHSKDD